MQLTLTRFRPAFYRAIKLIATVGFLLALYFQLGKLKDQEGLITLLTSLFTRPFFHYYIVLSVALTLLNYSLESLKWQSLLRIIGAYSYWRSVASVTSGMLFAIFTPARLGEYGGRVLLLPGQDRLRGVSLMLVSSVAQNLVILIMGAVSCLFLLEKYFHFSPAVTISTGIILLSVAVLGLFLYFNLGLLTFLSERFRLPRKIEHALSQFRILNEFNPTQLIFALLLSALRVVVWAALYILILHWVAGTGFNPWFLAAVFCIFLLQTGMPLPPITGIIARGSIAVFMWKFFGIQEWEALLSTFILYFFNLLVPSFVGLCVVMTHNLNK